MGLKQSDHVNRMKSLTVITLSVYLQGTSKSLQDYLAEPLNKHQGQAHRTADDSSKPKGLADTTSSLISSNRTMEPQELQQTEWMDLVHKWVNNSCSLPTLIA